MNCKLFLSGVLFAAASFSLHAAGNDCCSGLDLLRDCHSTLDVESPFIYIAENAKIYDAGAVMIYKADDVKIYKTDDAKIYDNNFLFLEQIRSNKIYRKQSIVNTVATEPAENKIVEEEPDAVVLPAFPLAPSASCFLQGGRESAAISPQQRQDEQQSTTKACHGKTFQFCRIIKVATRSERFCFRQGFRLKVLQR